MQYNKQYHSTMQYHGPCSHSLERPSFERNKGRNGGGKGGMSLMNRWGADVAWHAQHATWHATCNLNLIQPWSNLVQPQPFHCSKMKMIYCQDVHHSTKVLPHGMVPHYDMVLPRGTWLCHHMWPFTLPNCNFAYPKHIWLNTCASWYQSIQIFKRNPLIHLPPQSDASTALYKQTLNSI